MNNEFTDELLRRLRPTLQRSHVVHGALPLEIKLRLERLRLIEIIRSEGLREAPPRLPPPVGDRAMPAYAMT